MSSSSAHEARVLAGPSFSGVCERGVSHPKSRTAYSEFALLSPDLLRSPSYDASAFGRVRVSEQRCADDRRSVPALVKAEPQLTLSPIRHDPCCGLTY